MEGKAKVEEQLELFNETTGEKKQVDPNSGQELGADLGIKVQKRELVETGVDPDAPFIHYVLPAGKPIQTGDILAHWVLVHGQLSVLDCVKALHKHAGEFLELLNLEDSQEIQVKCNKAIVKILGDHVAMQGCLINVLPSKVVDDEMMNILNGKVDILA